MSYDEKSRRVYRQGDDPNFEVGWSEENEFEYAVDEQMAWESY
jgi:hypothetical protein